MISPPISRVDTPQLVAPTSPTTTRHRVWVYTLRGTRRNPWAWLVRRLLSWLVVKVARQVVLEDAPIFADVQKGLEASAHPGVIGTREERIYAFQKYVLAACGRPHPEGKDGDGALSPLAPSPRREEAGRPHPPPAGSGHP